MGHGVAAAVVDLVGRIPCRGRAGIPFGRGKLEAVDVHGVRGGDHQASKSTASSRASMRYL